MLHFHNLKIIPYQRLPDLKYTDSFRSAACQQCALLRRRIKRRDQRRWVLLGHIEEIEDRDIKQRKSIAEAEAKLEVYMDAFETANAVIMSLGGEMVHILSTPWLRAHGFQEYEVNNCASVGGGRGTGGSRGLRDA